jgi:acyl-CoA reductase-like NAD-dependent aldehyde dehydrogenase
MIIAMQQRRITPEERREVLERAKQTTIENTNTLVDAVIECMGGVGELREGHRMTIAGCQPLLEYAARTFERAIADEVSLLADEPRSGADQTRVDSARLLHRAGLTCGRIACQAAGHCVYLMNCAVARKP